MTGSISDYIKEFYRSLSEFNDVNKSDLQRANLLNSLLLIVHDELNLNGIALRVSDNNPTTTVRNYSTYGIERDQASSLLHSFNERVLLNLDRISISEFYPPDAPNETVGDQAIGYVYKITSKSDIVSSFFLYTRKYREYDDDTTSLLSHGVKFISNTYIIVDYLQQIRTAKRLDVAGFEMNSLPMFVLMQNYHVVRINDEGSRLFGPLKQLTSINFFDQVVAPENRDEIQQGLVSMEIGGTLEFNDVVISTEYGIFDKEELIETHLYFKKIQFDARTYYITSMMIVDQEKRSMLKNELDSFKNSLYQELKSFGTYYMESNKEAISYGRDNFFPAAFSFVVNEVTGPLVLASSPEMEHDDIFEETIKLMAGLNTNQILKQGYLTGMTPWSKPHGELRWIAFYIENPEARGEIEIHLIGLVVKRDLLMIKPELSNPLLGLLLGSMNKYIDLIISDNADFTTEYFDHNRNFSTISVIQNILNELRSGSSELLAAYSLK